MTTGFQLILLMTLSLWTTVAEQPPKVGATAEEFRLKDIDGEEQELARLVERGPVVVVVLRGNPGYQCPICSKQVGEFLKRKDDFRRANATVLLVYPGPSADLTLKAKEFKKGKDYPEHFLLVTDPDYAFTNAYGLRWDAPGETAKPATFVVDAERNVRFAKISDSHGGRASAAEALKAIPKR